MSNDSNATDGFTLPSLATDDVAVANVWAPKVQDAINKWETQQNDWQAIATQKTNWQQVLAGLTGIYGLIKQHGIIKEYLKLAKEQVAQAERYLKLAESHYNEVALPTYKCQKELFTRYLGQFGGYETKFIAEAFRLCEYCPDYKLQEGRAIATVQAQFDRAQQQRRRQVGKYNTGRACHDATQFAISGALAKVAAVNHAYRFEENRKFKIDQWYWQRKLAGASFVADMRGNVISGLNGGASVATSALGGIASALSARGSAVDGAGSGYGALASFYGGLAQTGFTTMGYGIGRNAAMPYGAGMYGGSQGLLGSVMPGGGSSSGGSVMNAVVEYGGLNDSGAVYSGGAMRA